MKNVSVGRALVVVVLLAFTERPAAAENDRVKACLDLNTTLEQRECAQALFGSASAELNEVYRRSIDSAVTVENAKPDASKSGTNWPDVIAASEKTWEVYRDAECWGVVGRPGGSGRLVWVYGCLAEKTFERIAELKVPFDQR